MSPAGRTSLIALVAALAAVTACRRSQPQGPMRTFVHRNGLSLVVPETIAGRRVSATPTPAGFTVHLDPRAARLVASALVTYDAGATTPAGAWPETRTVRGRKIHYTVDSFPDASAGSGGHEHALRAWEPAPRGHIEYAQRAQTEDAPDFSLIWAIVDGTRPPPAP